MLAPEDVAPLVQGGCFCGYVPYAIYGPPVLSAYCHCTNCQRLMGCPFVHTMHVKEIHFAWLWPQQQPIRVEYYESPEKPHKRRFWCKKCGTPVASFNSKTGEYSVWGATLERGPDGEILGWEQVKPTAHQFYNTRMLDVNDGLGKWEGYQDISKQINESSRYFS